MENNIYICSVCGGSGRINVKGMTLCTRCGAILSMDIEEAGYRGFREIGNITSTSIEFKMYRLKKKLYEICDELGVPTNIREAAYKNALELIRSGHIKMKATTLSIISLLYTTKLMGNIVLYEKTKKYADKYRRGRHRIGSKKHSVFRSIGWREPRINTLAYINFIAKRVAQLEEATRNYSNKYIRNVVKTALEMYINNRTIFLGKKPSTVAAILLYLAEEKVANIGRRGNRLFNVDTLSRASGVSRNTVKNRIAQYRRLLKLE